MLDPEKITSEYLKGVRPGTALDVGCGNGRVSSLLLQKGAVVTGIDKKETNISNRNFRFIHQDIDSELPLERDKRYDMITAFFILHFLSNTDANRIIEDMKEHTEVGGYNFLACLSKKDETYRKDRFYPNSSELKKLYSDWKIIKSTEGFTDLEEHDNLKPHRHNIVFLLVKKD